MFQNRHAREIYVQRLEPIWTKLGEIYSPVEKLSLQPPRFLLVCLRPADLCANVDVGFLALWSVALVRLPLLARHVTQEFLLA